MSPPRGALWALAVTSVTGMLLVSTCTPKARQKRVKETEPVKLEPASVERRPQRLPQDLRWIAFGGGSDPLSNQISIAQDLELAGSMFAGPGYTMFASGPGAQVAVVRSDESPELPLPTRARTLLARLLAPAGSEGLRYQRSALAIDAPATRDLVASALSSALEVAGDPLLVLAASHGDHGASARENALALWGGWSLNVEDLADTLDRSESVRPTRFVVTACYGGGFAELAFVGADPKRGDRDPNHCGLFAAPWDDESSGCDPDPNRVKQESFTIHFLSALRGQTRNGERKLAQIDLDQDSKVSLLEAHAWARVHAHSLDVPTTTSERYLREYAPAHEASKPAGEREEMAVIDALANELELPDERSALAKLRELERILADASDELDQAQAASDDGFYALRIALLERWPLLDHSWDPRAEGIIESDAAQIVALLSDSELAQAYLTGLHELSEAQSQHDAVRIARARVQRLVHAFETVRLAGALEKRGGPHWAHYQALRECERFVPTLR